MSYTSPITAQLCAYDGSGDLFISNGLEFSEQKQLAELPKGASQFTEITVPSTVGKEGGLLGWDGEYMTWEETTAKKGAIYRLSISGSQAAIVGKTSLRVPAQKVQWGTLYDGDFIAPYSIRGGNGVYVGYWPYPAGGNPQKNVVSGRNKRLELSMSAVSVAPSK